MKKLRKSIAACETARDSGIIRRTNMAIENARMVARQTTNILKQTVQETASNSSDSTIFILYQITGLIFCTREIISGRFLKVKRYHLASMVIGTSKTSLFLLWPPELGCSAQNADPIYIMLENKNL